ncbi:MAG: GNAT family N-acetyltransferase [Clostridiales bacterium]|jgi:GNAT superfamily N-acetyltransferase|nr:GNAT family N-acetyltransferase [Clostridiales bacterium]
MVIETKWFVGFDDDLSDALKIREEAFGERLAPQKSDEDSFVLVAYENGEPVATGRLYIKDGVCELGAIAVVKERRREGLGDFIVRVLTRRAFDAGFLTQSARPCAKTLKLYQNIGFKIVERYDDGGALMTREGDVGALDGCGSVKGVNI